MEELKYVSISEITPNPYQPRQEFNQNELQELTNSIKENGIIQPLIVRKSSVIGYELLAGERRLKASQLAGLEKIPVVVKTLSDDEMRYQSIIENLQRSDLNPIEEALSYQKILDKGITHEALAQIMGKSRPYITNSLRLLHLSEPIQEALKKGELSQGHARLLISMSSKRQEEWLQQILEKEMSVRALEQALSAHKTKRKKNRDSFLIEEEKKLKKLLGLPVRISENKKGSGHLQISFHTIEEYQKIIHNLEKNWE